MTTLPKKGSPTHNAWANMKQRCYNKNRADYPRYGGRGIRVCERWHTFSGFFLDMGLRPDGLTLERKNNNGNYEPSNCVWADAVSQGNNKRNNQRVVVKGVQMPLAIAARLLGIKADTLHKRLRSGWSQEKAGAAVLFDRHGRPTWSTT